MWPIGFSTQIKLEEPKWLSRRSHKKKKQKEKEKKKDNPYKLDKAMALKLA